MYTLSAEEKSTPVLIYTSNTLVHGEVVSKQNIRVSVWLRTEGAPEYMQLLRPNVINLGGGIAKSVAFAELYLPTSEILGFHMAPPASDPIDYDESEMNRKMEPVSILLGCFTFRGTIRVSTQVDLGTSIVSSRTVWLSIYNVKITSPNLPQMGELQAPMVIIRPKQVVFALDE